MFDTKIINKYKISDLDFEYVGSNFTENEIIEKGYIQLNGKELLSRISNKIISGDYPIGYKFVTEIYENGTTEGINNVSSVDYGNWTIDFNANTLQLVWTNAWINTITRAYNVNGNIEFYDIDTGKWSTTFRMFKELKGE